MKITKTILECKNCDPNHELDKLNPRWCSVGKKVEYRRNFVGIYETEKFPTDYNEKLDKLICPFCNNKLIDTKFPHDDFNLIGKSSDWNRQVLDAMMELYKKDPIEYQLKLNQFKLQQEQKEEIVEKQRQENLVHCPYCNSTNVSKITGTERAISVIGLGIFSKKINKSFKCNNCGGTF